jgi:hypothetical protein
MRARMLDQQGQSAINIAALAATEVRQTGRAERDQFRNTVELRIDEVARVLVRGVRRAIRVHVDDGHDAMVGLIEFDGQLDRSLATLIRHTANRVVRATRRAGEVADDAAQGRVSNQRQTVRRTRNAVDRGDEVVEHRLVEGARSVDGASRGAVGSGNVRRTSRVNPVAEAAQAVGRASTIFNRAVVVGAQGRLDVSRTAFASA